MTQDPEKYNGMEDGKGIYFINTSIHFFIFRLASDKTGKERTKSEQWEIKDGQIFVVSTLKGRRKEKGKENRRKEKSDHTICKRRAILNELYLHQNYTSISA